MKINKLFMNDSGGTGGFDYQERLFDYNQVDTALKSLDANITNIKEALSNKITVNSYQGDAQAEVEAAIDSIRVNLQAVEEPLNEMRNKINEVSTTYAAREANIKSSLAGIASGQN